MAALLRVGTLAILLGCAAGSAPSPERFPEPILGTALAWHGDGWREGARAVATPEAEDLQEMEPGVEIESMPLPAPTPVARRTFMGEISAYCHAGRTASGAMTQPGVAAMAGVPFGTRLHVDGIGTVIVLDRGGAIWGNRIDVWFSDCRAAIRWGRQAREVRVLE